MISKCWPFRLRANIDTEATIFIRNYKAVFVLSWLSGPYLSFNRLVNLSNNKYVIPQKICERGYFLYLVIVAGRVVNLRTLKLALLITCHLTAAGSSLARVT